MRSTHIYLLTLNSPSHKALRLWTGRSLHALRHCSVKHIGSALVQMQKNVDALQESMGRLQQVKEQFVSVSAASVRETMEKDKRSLKQGIKARTRRVPSETSVKRYRFTRSADHCL